MVDEATFDDCYGKFYSEAAKECKECLVSKDCMTETYKAIGKTLPKTTVTFDDVLKAVSDSTTKSLTVIEKAGYKMFTDGSGKEIQLSCGKREVGMFFRDFPGNWKISNILGDIKAGFYRVGIRYGDAVLFDDLKKVIKAYWNV